MSADDETRNDAVIFPQLSGLNWPSHVLQAWLTLRALGVPEANPRFIPEWGHVAQPEIVEADPEEDPDDDEAEPASYRHPRGPRYDAATGRVTVQRIEDPRRLRPRLTVNVRSEIAEEKVVGRLAHFVEPLSDLPGSSVGDVPSGSSEKPLARLTRQVAACYPELMATLSADVRDLLRDLASGVENALAESDPNTRARLLNRATLVFARAPGQAALDLAPCAEAFLRIAAKLPAYHDTAKPVIDAFAHEGHFAQALARFHDWSSRLFVPDAAERRRETERFARELSDEQTREQQELFRLFQAALDYETPRERARIVRHLLEILTTEAFTSIAAIDCLWGVGWLHGRMSDFGLPPAVGPLARPLFSRGQDGSPPPAPDPLLLSVTGGLSHRTLLLTLMQGWAHDGAFLGVGQRNTPDGAQASNSAAPPGRNSGDRLNAALFDAGQQAELWSLVTGRRETGDPLILLEIAAQRLVHPGIEAKLCHYAEAAGVYDTLWAQPGRTAVLGGKARLLHPGVEVYVPLAENADEAARVVGAKISVLLRLFLPITLRAQVIWQQGLADLGGGGAYLRHPFQTGVRFADSGR